MPACSVHVLCGHLQLLGVTMPSRFDQARVQQETAVQGIEQAREQKEVAIIDATTRVNKAREEAAVIVLQAEAEAEALRLSTDAKLESLKARYLADQESYKNLATKLGMDVDQLLAYIWLDATAQGMAGASVQVDFPATVASFNA